MSRLIGVLYPPEFVLNGSMTGIAQLEPDDSACEAEPLPDFGLPSVGKSPGVKLTQTHVSALALRAKSVARPRCSLYVIPPFFALRREDS